MTPDGTERPRRRRRAVGPPGAVPADEASLGLADERLTDEPDPGEDERLRRDRPPHHDRGV